MQAYRPKELVPSIHMVTVWNNKSQFEKAEDQSPLWVLFVVGSGSFRFEIGKREGIAEKGDLVLCPPDVVLKREMLRPASFLVLYFTWTADSDEIRAEEQLLPNPAGKSSIRDKYRFASTYGYIAMLGRRNDAPAAARRNFLLRDLWEQLDWEWETHRRESRPIPDDPLMQKAGATLKESAFETISLNQLAASMGLSTVQFSRRFHKMYGVNPSEYVSELRLDKARALLLENRLTLDEIAVQCGYSNGFYFSRVFSQKMRISPSEYRQAYRI
ncbi:helix-turn-helix transcriptional regulator [Paenibacillus hemerocallicola]|uniref:Helix-turn-helix transcriptional regulator n=1 Tax=Paenibacillus hemerocallicola TaxID=1172614 RepID=A0A5C4T3Z8_9BACL|nr:AraC family transcriptional regulator [Paenibacillus hemerocallicola]TNJ62869.1 helix-turn-helix transcriptional regulator [Paenibacillus hemerocallicola]